MDWFAPRLRMLAALATVVVALGGSAAAHSQDAFVLEVTGPETALVTQTIREEIASLGAAPSGRLSVVRADSLVTVTYVAADGRVIERTITTQRGRRESAQEIALLAVSMMRDDGAPPVPEPPVAEDSPVVPEAEAKGTEPDPLPAVAPAAAPERGVVLRDRPASERPSGRAVAAENPCAPAGRSMPVSFDVFPYVGMSSLPDVRSSTRGLALNLFGGLGTGLRGVEVGTIFNIETAGVCGLHIAGAVNVARGAVRGIEVAGAVNVTGAFEGAQLAGSVNVSRDLLGVQISGAVNVARGDVAGAQLTGGVNVAQAVAGVQLGTINVASGRVRGVQIGLVNVADSSDFSLGLVNVNTEGRTHIDVWSELEVGMLFSAVKHGGQHWHSFYGIGTRLTDPNLMAVFGIGGHIRFADWFYLNVDGLAYLAPSFEDGELNTLAQARAVAGFNVIDELAFYAGPAFNAAIGRKQDNEWAPDYGYRHDPETGIAIAMWPGATVGMQVLSE